MANGRLFRSDRGTPAKYGMSAMITLLAAAVFTVLAVALRTAIGTKKLSVIRRHERRRFRAAQPKPRFSNSRTMVDIDLRER
jgi:hypothetical protein